jgi:hypothetical protein
MSNVIALPEYRFIPLVDMLSKPIEVDWLVEDYLPSDSIGMLFGASGSGKSHIALSLAIAVADGEKWFGHSVKQGNVLVMAGEGNNGLNRRLQAIQKQFNTNINPDNIHFSERALGVDTEQGFSDLQKAIEVLDTIPSLIIIDTLSRHLLQSQENSNDDMAQFINKLEQIRFKYNCTIMIVHHTGKSAGQGARGASALKANIDFSFEVKRGEGKFCCLTCDKQKDADDDLAAKNFKIESVDLGQQDKNGKEITGACIIPTIEMPNIALPSLNKYENIAQDTFNPDKGTWQEQFVEACTDSANDNSKRKRFRTTVTKLEATGLVIHNEDGTYLKADT